MRGRIVFAFAGDAAGALAIPWLAATYGAAVVAVTVDVGQECDLDQVRARALALGAARAHVLDRREAFAQQAVAALHAARGAQLEESTIATMADPVVARAVAEVAAIEETAVVAHTSRRTEMTQAIRSASGALTVVVPPLDQAEGGGSVSRHLLYRSVSDVADAPDSPSQLDLVFEEGRPVAVNGVPLALDELIESVSLIAGCHGIGRVGAIEAPAAVVLHAALGALQAPAGLVRFQLHKGEYAILSTDSHLVSPA